MTILPSRLTTAGLKVPADSQVVPCGARMGVSEMRRRESKGKWSLAACGARRDSRTRNNFAANGCCVIRSAPVTLEGSVVEPRAQASGAEALVDYGSYGTAKGVPLQIRFPSSFHKKTAGPTPCRSCDVLI